MSGNFDYQKLFEKLPGLYLVLDSELFILSASDAYLRVTMTVREKIVGRYVFDVFPDNPADPTATGEKTIGESMRWVLEKGVPDAIYAKQYDIQRTEAEGGGFVERFWNAYQLPIFDANGKIAGILQQVEDVTELIKARGEPRHEGNHPRPGPAIGRNDETLLKLKESQERYELALSGSNDGLWDWNVVTNRLFWSERFKEMLGITDKNFQPSYEEFKIRIHPNERESIVETLELHTRKRTPYFAEFRMRTESGRYIWVRSRGAGLWNEAGEAIRMTGSVSDITEQKLAEESLRHAIEQAESANRAKSEFLAHMSHELRTPLNSIIGLTALLQEDTNLPEDHRAMISIASRSALTLLSIVNDILDLSKIEERELVLEKIVFPLEDVVDSLMDVMLPLASQKGLTLACNVYNDQQRYLIGDPLRLSRIMINLVGNAIKYTPKGSITISLRVKTEDSGTSLMEFSVTDTGIGIPLSKQALIFEKFTQADSSITRKYGGTGLGLYITRQLVERMGGTIGLDSEEGKGSRFWFRIPFETAETRPIDDKMPGFGENTQRLPAEQRKDAHDVRVLVAEDHPLNREFMQRLLPRLGIAHFSFVENGEEALKTFNLYDLILMDCHMPGMSGYEATSSIREIEKETGGHIPIIAVTADAMVGTRERTQKAGMDDYITKPIDLSELRHIMSRWVSFPEKGAGQDASKTTVSDDNNLLDLTSLKEFASNQEELRLFVDMFITQSTDGLKVLRENCVAGECSEWREACHKLKGGAAMIKAEKLRLLCEKGQAMAVASAEERESMLAQIRVAVDEANRSLRQAMTDINVSVSDAQESPLKSVRMESHVKAPIDMARLEVFAEGDQKQESMLVKLFLETGETSLEALKAFSKGEVTGDQWDAALHKLKGSSAHIGARELAELCEKAERGAQIGPDQKLALIKMIEEELVRVKTFFSERQS